MQNRHHRKPLQYRRLKALKRYIEPPLSYPGEEFEPINWVSLAKGWAS